MLSAFINYFIPSVLLYPMQTYLNFKVIAVLPWNIIDFDLRA